MTECIHTDTLVHAHRVPHECISVIAKYTESMRVYTCTHITPHPHPHPPPLPILVQSVSEKFISGVTQLRNHMAVTLKYRVCDSSPMSWTFSTGWVKVHYTTRSTRGLQGLTFQLVPKTNLQAVSSWSQLQIYIAHHSTATISHY